MNKYLVLIAGALLAFASTSYAANMCASPDAQIQSVAISAAATTKLLTGTATTRIHVCHYDFTAATGTAATYTLKEGTGSTCGTGTTANTGDYIGGGVITTGGSFGDVFSTLLTDNLCIVLGGSGGSAQGILSYVIQAQ